MDRAIEPALREPLMLTLSRIHRSSSVEQLRQVFLNDIPRLIRADAYGMYLFDGELKTRAVFARRAKARFLSEYEEQRSVDPLLSHVLKRKKFTHSLAMYSESEWAQQPLYQFLSRWGLAFSIEAPLLADGAVVGTINFAIGDKAYFSRETLNLARFLCRELDVCCGRLLEMESLRRQLADNEPTKILPGTRGTGDATRGDRDDQPRHRRQAGHQREHRSLSHQTHLRDTRDQESRATGQAPVLLAVECTAQSRNFHAEESIQESCLSDSPVKERLLLILTSIAAVLNGRKVSNKPGAIHIRPLCREIIAIRRSPS